MTSHNLKIHEQCRVAPPPSPTQTSLPLTFFDLIWLRLHPLEPTFFYSLPPTQSHPSFFYANMIKKRVLSKWDMVEESGAEPSVSAAKPHTLSSFVVSCAHALVCMAKAVHGVEREKEKFACQGGDNIVGLAESRDGSGGVEVGLVLKKHQMDLFRALFHQGLSHD
ncbi:hypothetical protein VNO78_15045 [Psophocarpus tetragonolobus]|uniref:Uncharacterized protein n=1 Tax=Psophocarpus tetragonolobus TaxID=3891 RepID=A0AAN9SDX3_PSOTE